MSLRGLGLSGPDIGCPQCSNIVKPLLIDCELDFDEWVYVVQCPACQHEWKTTNDDYRF
jgi:hypothetical protein